MTAFGGKNARNQTLNPLSISANDRRRFAARSGKINSMKGGGTQPQSGQGTCQSHTGERHCRGRAVHSCVRTAASHEKNTPRAATPTGLLTKKRCSGRDRTGSGVRVQSAWTKTDLCPKRSLRKIKPPTRFVGKLDFQKKVGNLQNRTKTEKYAKSWIFAKKLDF